MLATFTKGHGFIAGEPGGELLVGDHRVWGVGRVEHDAPQGGDDLICVGLLGGDHGVKADQRRTQWTLE